MILSDYEEKYSILLQTPFTKQHQTEWLLARISRNDSGFMSLREYQASPVAEAKLATPRANPN